MITLKDFEIQLPTGEKLFKPINMNIQQGAILVVTGPNGAGKSTFLNHLAKNACKENQIRLSPHQICYLPQKYGHDFNFPFTLRDALYQPHLKQENSQQYQILKTLNLNRSWRTASGGERKKTLLLRCLLQEPELIMLDEPFNHLDQNSREIFLADLSHFLNLHPQTVIILITHDDLSQFLMNRNVQYLDLH
jgi:zinc transport system ATP-binding protein